MEMSDEPNAKPISGLSSVASCAVGLRLPLPGQEPEETRHAQQPQPHHQHAGDGAAAKRHIQRRANALRGCLRGAHVGAHRDIHADEPQAPESTAPTTKPTAVVPSRKTPISTASTTPTRAMVLYWRAR